jgi:hypothetical protein
VELGLAGRETASPASPAIPLPGGSALKTATVSPAARGARAVPPQSTPPVSIAPAEDDSPDGFDDATETAFLAEARERGETIPIADSPALEEIETKSLPELEELVKRIPAEVRATLDELFRARFVSVKRVPKKVLKR